MINHHEIYLLLKLIFNFLNHAAWPMFILFVFLYFRKSLKILIQNIPLMLNKHEMSFSFGNISVNWSTIREMANSTVKSPVTGDKKTNSSESPLEIILKSYILLETEIINIFSNSYDVIPESGTNRPVLMRTVLRLYNENIISNKLYKQIRTLRIMRNNIVHGNMDIESLTIQNANDYKSLVESVILQLKNIGSKN